MTAPKAKKKAKPPSRKASIDRVGPFVEAYLQNGLNATKAAVAAGFSPNGAGVTGSRMLRKANVLALLANRQAELQEKAELNTERILKNLSQTLYFDPRKLYNADGSLKRVIDLDDDTAMALSGVEVVESLVGKGEDAQMVATKKYKWLDKNQARDQAHKIRGHYEAHNVQPNAAMAAAVDKMAGIEAVKAKFAKVLGKA